MILLVKLIQREQIKPLQLHHVVPELHHGKFCIGVESTTEFHEDAFLETHRSVGYDYEKEDGSEGPKEHQDSQTCQEWKNLGKQWRCVDVSIYELLLR